jgi:WD40 repeat protein
MIGQVKTLAISPNGHSAVIGSSTGTVSVFDVRSGGILGTLKVPEGEVLKVRDQNFCMLKLLF